MTIDAKAREFANWLSVFYVDEPASDGEVKIIADAFVRVRNEALEEAAKVAEDEKHVFSTSDYIAIAIRSLKDGT